MNARQSRRERSGHGGSDFIPERKLITAYTAALLFATVASCFIPEFSNSQKIRINIGNGPTQRVKEFHISSISKNANKVAFGFENLANFSKNREVIWYKALVSITKHDELQSVDNITAKSITCKPSLTGFSEIYRTDIKKPQRIDIYLWVKSTSSSLENATFAVQFSNNPLNTLKAYYYILAAVIFIWVWFILQKYTCGSEDRKWFITVMKSYFLISSLYSLLHFITTKRATISILYTFKIIIVSLREMFSIAYVSAIMLPLMPPTFSRKFVLGIFIFLMLTVFFATFLRQCIPLIGLAKREQERLYSLCLGYRESIRITFFAFVFLVGQAVRKKRMQNKYIVFHYMCFIPVNFIPLVVDFLMDVLHTKKPTLHFICNELYDMIFIGLETIRLLPALKAMSYSSKNLQDDSMKENAIQAIPSETDMHQTA